MSKWYSHPSTTLWSWKCEWSAVQKQFCQILSIESGSQEELEKHVRIMYITTNIEADKDRVETVKTNLNMHLQRISIERRSLMRACTNYRHRTRNDNRKDHWQKIIEALDCVNFQIQQIDSSILNLRNRVIIIKSSIYCDEKTVKTLESEVKQLLWYQRKKEASIHTKVERILTKYKFTIQEYPGCTLTDSVLDSYEEQEFWID